MRGIPSTQELTRQHAERHQEEEYREAIRTPTPAEFAECIAEDITNAMATLEKLPAGRERSLVQTKLDEAMLWLPRAVPPTNEAQQGG